MAWPGGQPLMWPDGHCDVDLQPSEIWNSVTHQFLSFKFSNYYNNTFGWKLLISIESIGGWAVQGIKIKW